MNKFTISTVEREFVLKAVSERKRLDDREAFQYRQISISFGLERGCCMVDLGRTKVMAQVSCEVSAPKESRPTEGILFVNVELSTMAAPYFDSSRPSQTSAEVNRLLERCLKESGCVDLESLCIQSGIKVWVLRVDLHVLNNDGNMVDALCIAAISALNHFRRPDVNVCGEDVTVLTTEEKDPLPLTMHHLPLCATFGVFDEGKYILLDPTEVEENVMDGSMVICMNRHKEICVMQSTGNVSLLKEQIARCKEICFLNVCNITEKIQFELQRDGCARKAGTHVGFATTAAATTTTKEEGKAKIPKKKDQSSVSKTSLAVEEVVEAKSALDETSGATEEGVEMDTVDILDSDLDEDLELLKGRETNANSSATSLVEANSPASAKKSQKKKKKKKSKSVKQEA